MNAPNLGFINKGRNMAKLVKKGNDLAINYYKTVLKSILAFFASMGIFGALLWFFDAMASGARIAMAICGTIFLVASLVLRRRAHILNAGLQGEKTAAEVLKALPNGYTVVKNAVISHQGKQSELDLIIVGESGVFVVEAKNMKGDVYGDCDDKNWRKEKHRGENVYRDEFYSPVKQVRTHVHRLAGLLRDKGIKVFVEGVVYFASDEAVLHISGDSNGIAVLAFTQGDDVLVDHILSGKANLDPATQKRILKALK